MRNIFLCFITSLIFPDISSSVQQADTTVNKKEKIKQGWSMGAVPVIAFDQDQGWKFGGVVNFYDYGNGNIEFRWKVIKTVIQNQNLYLALNAFTDFGMVTGKYKIDKSGVPDEYLFMFPDEKEKPHISYGLGLHIALNQNFIIASNFGVAADKRDGKTGLYIGLNWLF